MKLTGTAPSFQTAATFASSEEEPVVEKAKQNADTPSLKTRQRADAVQRMNLFSSQAQSVDIAWVWDVVINNNNYFGLPTDSSLSKLLAGKAYEEAEQ